MENSAEQENSHQLHKAAIDKVLGEAKANTLTADSFVSSLLTLASLNIRPDQTKTFLQTIAKKTDLEKEIKKQLVNNLVAVCKAQDIEQTKAYLQTFTLLGLDQQPEVTPLLDRVREVISKPKIFYPPPQSTRPEPSHDLTLPTPEPSPVHPQVKYRHISRRAFIGVGFGTALTILVGGKLALNAAAVAQKTASGSPTSSSDILEDLVAAAPLPQNLKDTAPAAEILPPPNPHLGIRNDIVEFMEWVPSLGTNNIRIDGGMSTTLAGKIKEYKIKSLLNKAKEMNLNVLYVFNPQGLLTQLETERRLEAILNSGANVTVELMNEPNIEFVDRFGNDIDYWKGDMASCAEFVKLSLASIDHLEKLGKIKPGTKLVVAAPTTQKDLREFIYQLKTRGIDPSQLTFAAHAYHTPEEVKRVAQMIKKETGGNIMFTEIGVDHIGKDQLGNKSRNIENLIKMYEAARFYTEDPIYIHELPDNGGDPATNERFGFVELHGGRGTPLPTYNTLKQGISDAEKNLLTNKAAASFP